jgi:Type 9 secretion system plug protein 1st domain
MKTRLLIIASLLFGSVAFTQDQIFNSNIKTVKLYRIGDQTSFPIVSLGSTDGLELHFDDLDNHVKNYYYTFQLCNVDWSPSMLHPFEYIKGFQNVRITTYRNSSLSTTRYIHYQANVPDRNCYPNHSGNYLLKVFLDNDTSKLVFTKRMIVADNKATVGTQILQPFNTNLFRTAQKLNVVVQTDNRIQVLSPNDIKVVILQNNNWQTSVFIDRPTIYRGNYYEYSDESQTALPAGKEFRWVDLRSLRLKSDRMQDINNHGDTVQVAMRPDPERSSQVYVYYRDLNGSYTIETMESINPFWQGDYAMVHFTYVPPANRSFQGNDLYLFGEFTNYASDTTGRMNFNKETGAYEKTLFLKQGYYNYLYVLKPLNGKGYPDFSSTEGNYYATENAYTVLVYYRPFGARADEVIAYASLNSVFQR